MRKLGFALLFLGFVWLGLLQLHFSMGAGVRSVLESQYDALPADTSHAYTRDDVEARIFSTAVAFLNNLPWVMPPGCLMLAGGLLLAFAPRRRSPSDVA